MEGKKRFAPELVSTSHQSSRSGNLRRDQATNGEAITSSDTSSQGIAQQDTQSKPRRFAAQLLEETEKGTHGGSQQSKQQDQKPKPRRFAPQLVDETETGSKRPRQDAPDQNAKPKPRQFAPQLVDESSQSSKAQPKPETTGQNGKSKPRRFAPQLVEESEKGSKGKAEVDSKHHVKFKPEPIATTYGSSRKGQRKEDPTLSQPDGEENKAPPRKFTPILLDTARRSRRAGDPNAPIAQDYRTEYGYHIHAREHWRRLQGDKTPTARSENDMDVDDAAEGADDDPTSPTSDDSQKRRAPAPLDGSAPSRPTCLVPNRQHSFRMPSLDTIESSESENDSIISSVPSTPRQEGSPIAVKTDSFELFKHATKRRESIDDDWQHYLLDLERKKAQERLEEQALAAYPNADFGYQHANHYFIDEDDSDQDEIEERPTTFDGDDDEDLLEMARRESTANMSFEQREMQRHAEEAQQERNAAKPTTKQQLANQSPFVKDLGILPDAVDTEMKSMRDRARPPMLGNDIVFPRCSSPDPARFDVTQSSSTLRNQMCYLTAAAEAERKRSGEEGGLWNAPKDKDKTEAKSPVSTTKSPVSAKASPAKGLWGGFCHDDGETPTSPGGGGMWPGAAKATGLMTPKQEAPNPFQLSLTEGRPVGLMTPDALPLPGKKLRHRTDLEQLDAKLVSEREIDAMMEREYPDSFITQVYNYLSLGYPSLARAFDDELAKISRISIADLRHDDEIAKATPRGYIRLGPDFEGGGGEGLTEESCMRWQALKRYVKEWARQEKNMVKTEGAGGNWGTTARRGSWAI